MTTGLADLHKYLESQGVPGRTFWENDLEMAMGPVLGPTLEDGFMATWMQKRTGRQADLLGRFLGGGVDGSTRKRKAALMGVAGLLTSEVYGLRSELDLETLGLLDEKRVLAAKEKLTDDERARLRGVDEQLRDLAFTVTTRDPMYKRFAEAMAARERAEGLQVPVLTREQQERQKQVAREVLDQLKASKGQAK